MPDQHPIDELSLLLPFYVNGTINHANRARIVSALVHSAELRAELAEVQELAALVKSSGVGYTNRENVGKSWPLPEPELHGLAGLAKLRPADSGIRTSRFRLARLVRPAPWHVAAAAGLATVVVAQSLWIASTPHEATYQTASGAPENTRTDALRLILRFTPEARWADIEAMLTAQKLMIVAGPAEGRFTVQAEYPSPDAVAILKSLEASSLIEFAGRVE